MSAELGLESAPRPDDPPGTLKLRNKYRKTREQQAAMLADSAMPVAEFAPRWSRLVDREFDLREQIWASRGEATTESVTKGAPELIKPAQIEGEKLN